MNKTEIHWSRAFPGCCHISDYSQLFVLGRWSTKMKILLGNRQDHGSLECFLSLSHVCAQCQWWPWRWWWLLWSLGSRHQEGWGSPSHAPPDSSKRTADPCQGDANLSFKRSSRNLEIFLAFISWFGHTSFLVRKLVGTWRSWQSGLRRYKIDNQGSSFWIFRSRKHQA